VNFVDVPIEVQLRYLRLGLLPKHVMAAMIEEQIRRNAVLSCSSLLEPAGRAENFAYHITPNQSMRTGSQVAQVVSNQLAVFPISAPDYGSPSDATLRSSAGTPTRSLAVRTC